MLRICCYISINSLYYLDFNIAYISYFKVLYFAALIAVGLAQYGYDHGEAYSSQHISRHDGHPEIVHSSHSHDYYVSKYIQNMFNIVLIILYVKKTV